MKVAHNYFQAVISFFKKGSWELFPIQYEHSEKWFSQLWRNWHNTAQTQATIRSECPNIRVKQNVLSNSKKKLEKVPVYIKIKNHTLAFWTSKLTNDSLNKSWCDRVKTCLKSTQVLLPFLKKMYLSCL